ncbi:hypothetical protein ABXV20_27615 [Bacillus paranthracis]|uniref:hypothetical protein n=1 Tax=Bacillus cereus group TaxID=86661 RepID=UPI001648C9D8|nr:MULTISPECIES: hypothetical protein [unclassified Bacillus cereus group]MDA1792132.1 hypothetical protein [Bacillus cereus group sp. BY5-1LC]MDA2158616.1 hypothetical protein [Bacillus cereus group sp. Bc253]
MSNFKKSFEVNVGKEKKFYIHTNQHEYKFSLKKIHTEKETEKEVQENIMEWTPSKVTLAGIGTTATVVATWISSLF